MRRDRARQWEIGVVAVFPLQTYPSVSGPISCSDESLRMILVTGH